MILKPGMEHRRRKLYKGYLNDDPGLSLTYFTARSNLVAYAFMSTLIKSHLVRNN